MEITAKSVIIYQSGSRVSLSTGYIKLPDEVHIDSIHSEESFDIRVIPYEIVQGDTVIIKKENTTYEGTYVSSNDKMVKITTGKEIIVIREYDTLSCNKAAGNYLSLPENTAITFMIPIYWEASSTLILDQAVITVLFNVINNTNTTLNSDSINISTGGKRQYSRSYAHYESVSFAAPMAYNNEEQDNIIDDVRAWNLDEHTIERNMRMCRIIKYIDMRATRVYKHRFETTGVIYAYRITNGSSETVIIPDGRMNITTSDTLIGSDTVRETVLRAGETDDHLDISMGKTPQVKCDSSVEVSENKIYLKASIINETDDILYLIYNPNRRHIISSTVDFEMKNGELVFSVKGSTEFSCVIVYDEKSNR